MWFMGVAEGGAPIERDRRLVAVAHGRDDAARRAVFQFLRALGLQPLEWEALVARTASAAPYSGEAVQRGFAAAQAVVVLLTPDDVVQLHPDLADAPPVLQARPNVLLEAGMALATHSDRTLLVVIGNVELPSNLVGRNVIRLDGGPVGLNAMAGRLEDAMCAVNRHGKDWLDTSLFAQLGALERKARTGPDAGEDAGGDEHAALSVFLRLRGRASSPDSEHIDVVASNVSSRPVTVVTMGLMIRAEHSLSHRSERTSDGVAEPALRAVLHDGETVVMSWQRSNLVLRHSPYGTHVIVGCFAQDGRGIEVEHALPQPIRLDPRAPKVARTGPPPPPPKKKKYSGRRR